MATALGCGGRTDTLFDGEGGYGEETGIAGGSLGGGSSQGGQRAGGNTGFGGSFPTAGSGFGAYSGGGYGEGGGYTAGSSSIGGYTAGSSSIGGYGAVGGANVGGYGAVGGVGLGGFVGVAGIGGAGGTGVIVDSCVAAAQSACNKCQCQTCGSELNSCFSDLTSGCAQIVLCTQLTQCQGLACYVACISVITANGGLAGNAVAQAFALANCANSSNSSCGCN